MKRVRSSSLVPILVAGSIALAACDDDNGTGPVVDLDAVAGIYEPLTLTFDPQGSAPAADVLDALVTGGVEPELNISNTGEFDIFFRDPVSGSLVLLQGSVQPVVDGVRLNFNSLEDANRVVLPRTLTLDYDAEAQTLGFSGSASVGRARLLELFPVLYQDEQLFDPTPGTLTVGWLRTGAAEE